MSNRATIIRRVFEDYSDGAISYGFCIYDDYAQDYFNLWDEKSQVPEDDKELLKEVIKSGCGKEIMEYVKENEKGVIIDDNWHDWQEIKDVF